MGTIKTKKSSYFVKEERMISMKNIISLLLIFTCSFSPIVLADYPYVEDTVTRDLVYRGEDWHFHDLVYRGEQVDVITLPFQEINPK